MSVFLILLFSILATATTSFPLRFALKNLITFLLFHRKKEKIGDFIGPTFVKYLDAFKSVHT